MTIREMQKRAFQTGKEKGFFKEGEPVNIDQKLLLTVGELVEAQNELRNGMPPEAVYFHNFEQHGETLVFDHAPAFENVPAKPEGFGVELADAVIRIADLCEALGLDLEALIQLKMRYNATRPYKHGKQF